MRKCWCGNDSLREYSTEYYRCESCNTLISEYDFSDAIYDVENEEQDLYGKNYWEVSMTKAAGKETLSEVVDMYLTERVVYWLKYVLKYAKLGGNVAEVGCGLGQLQYVLRRLDYNQLAFELSKDICDYMRQKLGVSVHCGPFEKSIAEFDAILAFDLFEHLLEPEEFIDYCNDSLLEGGIICMQTPCYNPKLSFGQMKEEAPRFEEQLKQEQHVYLYSKESISMLLRNKGYVNIQFVPAFFGDDYDMFLIASREEFHENTEQEIDDYLNSVPAGRLVKAMIALFDDKVRLEQQVEAIDNERNKILADVETLTQRIKADEMRIEEYSSAALVRVRDIESLTASNLALQRERDVLQQAAADRLSDVERVQKDNLVLQQAAADRLSDVERVQKDNLVLQQAAADRLRDVKKLKEDNSALQQVANERLILVEKLSQRNQVLQQAADERLALIEHLTQQNQILQQAADERLAIIETLTPKEE